MTRQCAWPCAKYENSFPARVHSPWYSPQLPEMASSTPWRQLLDVINEGFSDKTEDVSFEGTNDGSDNGSTEGLSDGTKDDGIGYS